MREPPPDVWNDYAAALGLAIARRRARLGASLEQVAAAAGISTFTYRKLESGLSNPRTPANPQLYTLARVAQALGVPIADLLPDRLPDVASGPPLA